MRADFSPVRLELFGFECFPNICCKENMREQRKLVKQKKLGNVYGSEDVCLFNTALELKYIIV